MKIQNFGDSINKTQWIENQRLQLIGKIKFFNFSIQLSNCPS